MHSHVTASQKKISMKYRGRARTESLPWIWLILLRIAAVSVQRGKKIPLTQVYTSIDHRWQESNKWDAEI